jgi:hypothetical protein
MSKKQAALSNHKKRYAAFGFWEISIPNRQFRVSLTLLIRILVILMQEHEK